MTWSGPPGEPEPPPNRPGTAQIALLQQWQTIYSGFRRLSDRLLADVELASGVDPASFQVLWFLLTTPLRAAPMNLLTQVLGFSTAGTTKVVDRLAEAGYVERRPSPTDRRVTFAALTTEGMTMAAEVSSTLAEALQRHLVEPLGAAQVSAFATALGSLNKSGDACASDC
ncbi:MAG TPA: MarR family transcriptional regulator [Actinocrinis sp.]|nr:MarR family transcriptional regulator [Actinocrinis sp.]